MRALPHRWLGAGFCCLLALFLSSGVSLRAQVTGAANPPATNPPTQPTAHDPEADLQRLLDQVGRLDPKSADYSTRLKGILQELIRVNQDLARENAALRRQLAGGRSARPARSAATGQPGASTGADAKDPKKSTNGSAFFGNRGTKKFHRAGCQFGERTRDADRVPFATPAEAVAAGYVACRVCRPDASPPAPAGAGSPPKP
jgi:hypothetical protein